MNKYQLNVQVYKNRENKKPKWIRPRMIQKSDRDIDDFDLCEFKPNHIWEFQLDLNGFYDPLKNGVYTVTARVYVYHSEKYTKYISSKEEAELIITKDGSDDAYNKLDLQQEVLRSVETSDDDSDNDSDHYSNDDSDKDSCDSSLSTQVHQIGASSTSVKKIL